MTGQKKHGGWGEKNTWFEKGCVSLAFFLSAVLILLFGIRIAGNTIQVAQAEKIEIINNLVEGLSESSKIKSQSKKVQSVVYKYLEAYIRAIAGFEFVPRNDFTVLTQILNSIPEETDVLSFVYHGQPSRSRNVFWKWWSTWNRGQKMMGNFPMWCTATTWMGKGSILQRLPWWHIIMMSRT